MFYNVLHVFHDVLLCLTIFYDVLRVTQRSTSAPVQLSIASGIATMPQGSATTQQGSAITPQKSILSLRYMAGVTWRARVRSTQVARCGVRELGDVLRVRRLWWFGHVVRRGETEILGKTQRVVAPGKT